MNLSLFDKNAVIIGGLGRIGENITEGLLESGASVYVITKNKSKHRKKIFLLKKKYKKFFCHEGDASNLLF